MGDPHGITKSNECNELKWRSERYIRSAAGSYKPGAASHHSAARTKTAVRQWQSFRRKFSKNLLLRINGTSETISRRTDGRSFKAKISKTYSRHSICRTGTCKCRDIQLISERRVDFPEINRGNSTICGLDNDHDKPVQKQW